MAAGQNPATGHRARLRRRFIAGQVALPDVELLELLLTYAIPRQDVSVIARALLQRYGSVTDVLNASPTELQTIAGVGEQTTVLFELVAEISRRMTSKGPIQPALLDSPFIALSDEENASDEQDDRSSMLTEELRTIEQPVRAFVNDEVANAQQYLPDAVQFPNLEAFQAYLVDRLPYNAETTRRRRARHIIERFFPTNSIDTPLVKFLHTSQSEGSRKSAIFYGLLRAEPLLRSVAEAVVWPALAAGRVTREELRTFVLRELPVLSDSSQNNVLRSIVTAYDLSDVATYDRDFLYVRLHGGELDAFVYCLCSEFPDPGIYRFEQLQQSLLHKGLLWDSEWMRRQLYLLESQGIIAKVSEIDAIRQFTVRYRSKETLDAYFSLEQRTLSTLRERSEEFSQEQVRNITENG